MSPRGRPILVVLAVLALFGAFCAGLSTSDFVAHLDRQVHAVTCSFVPGLAARDATGSSGCYAALMSPYSSVLRTSTWGGIPIALPGLAVFTFLLAFAVYLVLSDKCDDPDETRFLLAASLLPLLTSVAFLLIALLRVGVVCTLCAGIYAASSGVFVCALVAHLRSGRNARRRAGVPWPRYAGYFAQGVAFVAIPVVIYLALKPAYPVSDLAGCGTLLHPEDRYGVRVEVSKPVGGVPAIEVLDPLCPACKGFSQRLAASGLEQRLQLEMVLFPLDSECNWMVTESLHPGSCAVSEAVLAAGADAGKVLLWALDHQAELRDLGAQGQKPVYDRIVRDFPQLKGSLGKPAAKAQLNRSLRWVVANSLPVLTPQLYVGDRKVCDEDTDLGLEYVLSRLLAPHPGTAGGR